MPDPGVLPRAAPESVGVSSKSIERFLDAVEREGLELHSLMLMRAGRVIAEGWWRPYRAELRHMQHSLTKSFTATGVAFAEAEGLLRLDDRVVSFFPDELPDELPDVLGEHLRAMTVADLLTMRGGHRVGISGSAWRRIDTGWVREFFRAPVAEPPGTHFVYNSAASYMLSAIVQRCSGQRLRDYLGPRLFEPLGIDDLEWDVSPDGVTTGGNGLSCRTEHLLRFAALHLQDGVWQGSRVLPQGWAQRVAQPAVMVPPEPGHRHLPGTATPRGYGLHWWTGPNGAYYASGMFGQYAIVLPAHDAVLAITAAIPLLDRRLLDLVFGTLAVALGPVTAPNGAAGELAARLSRLSLPAATGRPTPPVTGRRRFAIAPNADGVREVTLAFDAAGCDLALADARGTHRVRAGYGDWSEGWTSMTGDELHHAYQPEQMRVAALGRWSDPATYSMTWQFIETAFCDTVRFRFDADRVVIERSVNVNSGPTTRPALHGTSLSA